MHYKIYCGTRHDVGSGELHWRDIARDIDGLAQESR